MVKLISQAWAGCTFALTVATIEKSGVIPFIGQYPRNLLVMLVHVGISLARGFRKIVNSEIPKRMPEKDVQVWDETQYFLQGLSTWDQKLYQHMRPRSALLSK